METNGRLPADAEFIPLVTPLLNQPVPAPVPLVLTNFPATLISSNAAAVSGILAQGIYGDDGAGVSVFWGQQDGGTISGAWENSQFIGVNSHFNPATFAATLINLVPNTNYFFRFYATNANGTACAPSSA